MGKTNSTRMIAIVAIIFAVYNLFVFLVFRGYNAVFWVSYIFTLLAFGIAIFCFAYSLKNFDIRAVVFNIPLMSFATYFLIVEVIAGIIFMAVRNVVNMKIAIFIQVLILAAFLIIAILSCMSTDYAKDVNTRIQQDVRYVQSFRVSLEGYADRCPEPTARRALEQLAETARYADQRSNPNAVNAEQRITQAIQNIDVALNRGDYQAVMNFCNQANMAFAERDRILRLG